MATIQFFDPALCCPTSVCGVGVDQAPLTFAAGDGGDRFEVLPP